MPGRVPGVAGMIVSSFGHNTRAAAIIAGAVKRPAMQFNICVTCEGFLLSKLARN